MAASIRSLVNAAFPIVGASRDDLRAGDVVTLEAADLSNTTYAWNIVYKPDGSTATLSGDVTMPNPGSFTVDLEGPYLIRLITDLGLATQNEQFVRLRFLTILGDLRLVAAGEQTDSPIPVPIDLDIDGWADDQNFNIQTLLALIKPSASSGRILYVDQNDGTEGYGDHDTVQDAIDAAVLAGAGVSTPWVVLVRPGAYTEDVVFSPHVHVFGWPGNSAGSEENRNVLIRPVTPGAALTAAVTGAGDRLVLSNLTLESVSVGTNPTLEKTGLGELVLHRSTVIQAGTGASQGAALQVTEGSVIVDSSRVQMSPVAPVDRPAISQPGAGTSLVVRDSTVVGPSGLLLNPSLVSGVTTEVVDSRIVSTGGAGAVAITSDAESLLLEYTRVEGVVSPVLSVHPSAAATADDVAVTLRWSQIGGDVAFDTTGIAGTASLNLGASEYGSLTFPGGPPTIAATTRATSLFYDNSLTGIAAENVQDAIDEVHALAVLVQTLDEAYDGGVPASGSGRTIIADQGPVQILDAAAPSDPPPPDNGDGNLEVVGTVKIGSLLLPELELNPNPYGIGPLLALGNTVTANNTPFGSVATIRANATGDPLYRNYNLRVTTESSEGGGRIGRLILRGGDALSNGASTPDAGSVYVQAGSANDAAGGDAGSVYLVSGTSQFSATGSIFFASSDSATPAVLTAAGPFVGGVTGTIRFGTTTGGISVDVDAADNLATVLAAFNATNQVVAIDSGGGVIELTTVATGPNAEIHYLNDTVSGTLDIALGTFDGQSQVNGSWANLIAVQATAANEISFGVGGSTGEMIYNSDTGKLTVPGLIDPTGMIFTQAGAPPLASGEGAIWVSDGSASLVAGRLYYQEFGGSAIDLTTGGGGGGSIDVEDEGGALGTFTTLNFTGAGVTATNGGGGTVDITIPGGGGGGGGAVEGVEQEEFAASGFVFGGSVSTVGLSQTPDTNVDIDGLFLLFRNGVADMDVTAGAPSTASEFRVVGSNLEIGADITGSLNDYRFVYPYAGGGALAGIAQEVYASAAFTFGAGVSSVTLAETFDTDPVLDGAIILFRNGVADMQRVVGVPSNSLEYRINGNDLEIGADITGSLHTYRIVYPHT